MRFLITCYRLDLSGSSTYTFTLASELKRKGHEVNVFSPFPEIIAEELKKKEIKVYKTLEEISNEKYSFIIAQHNILASIIRNIKPEVPMVFISHGILPFFEQPPSINISIQRYVAVSEEVKNNLTLNYGISPKSVDIIRNFVDVNRFYPQGDIGERPREVLVISNRLSPQVYEAIKGACEKLDLKLNSIGRNRQVVTVEDYINKADIIISLGRGILEGMACGRAAIVYDYLGADGMITPDNIGEIRKHNFSGRRFKVNYDVGSLIREIRKYDKTMGKINRELVLKDYNASVASDEIIDICNQIQKNFYIKPINKIVPTFNTGEVSLTNNRTEEHRSKTVSIIIPVFNNLLYTMQCLQSIVENTARKSYQLIIVDNGSTDDTKEFLKCLCGSAKVISNRENLGFSKACNQGAAVADGDYLVFLNQDTKVQPCWLKELIKILENDSDVGAVGSKLLYPDGSIQHAGVAIIDNKGRNPLSATHIFRRQPQDRDFVNVPMVFQVVTAACLALCKPDFESVGGFDESFWNGFEDVDLCFKLSKKGKKIVYQPKSVVIHYESKGGEERFKRTKQNFKLLLEKWVSQIEADIVINGSQVQEGISHAIQPYDMSDPPSTISRSHYMNALIQWVKYYYIGADRLPGNKLRFAIKTCTPSKQNRGWGDTYFANSLAKAFVNFGHKCEVHFRNEWDQLDNHIDIVIHIAGLYRYTPRPYNLNILWIINHPELHTFKEISQFDAVFCASKIHFENLKNNIKIPCFYLPQATDDEVFNPSKNTSTKDIDILFVGNNYYRDRKCRQIIQDVLETGKQYNLYIVGQGWHNILYDRYIKAEFVEWEKLPELYARAKIVLNDHQESMRQFGFVNNRTFDLAALKAFQISNYVEGIEEFGIVTYKTPEDLRQKLDYFLQNESERQEFANISNTLCQGYTFTNATREILNVVHRLLTIRSEPSAKNVIPELLKHAVWLFNKTFYVSCISMLNGIEVMDSDITKRFKNLDLLRAMALFAVDLKQQSLMYLNREIRNHNSPAAKQFIIDYFEKRFSGDIQNWCAKLQDLCDLHIAEAELMHLKQPMAYTQVVENRANCGLGAGVFQR